MKNNFINKEACIIGIDFDNTIINYENLLYAVARERKLIPATCPKQKKFIRDHIRALSDGEVEWQKIQATIYGQRIQEATLMEGVGKFMEECKAQHLPIYIISHKTQHSNFLKDGPDFQKAALEWMQKQGFFAQFWLDFDQIYFEPTREDKINRIEKLACTHFIDDLQEVFLEKKFPAKVIKILLAPEREEKVIPPNIITKNRWRSIHEYFFL